MGSISEVLPGNLFSGLKVAVSCSTNLHDSGCLLPSAMLLSLC